MEEQMKEEEKKAIERLKEIATNTYAEGKARAIDTILNLIAKLQRENEELKAEIQEKEKLINALVDYIVKEDIDELVCKHIKCVDNEEEKDCRECVKKFFESKIKESEN
jgi:hypothetical protein